MKTWTFKKREKGKNTCLINLKRVGVKKKNPLSLFSGFI